MRRWAVMTLVLLLALALPDLVQATAVGRFMEVEGRVDLMKGGKLPVVPAKVQDEVEPGDAIRTKSLSRAVIRFIDDTTLNIAPESRVAIEDYMYDAAKGQRRATLQVFRGLVHTVVSRIFQMEKPDFIMKTHTGVMGVRGTDWYAQLSPLTTDFYNASGKTEVSNIFPEIRGKVILTGMQFTRVGRDQPPTLPLAITEEDLQQLKLQLSPRAGMAARGAAVGGGGTTSPQDVKAAVGTTSTVPTTKTTLLTKATQVYQIDNPTVAVLTPPTVRQPTSPPPPPPLQPVTYNFILSSLGFLAPTGSFSFGGYGNGQGSSLFPGYFSWNGTGTVQTGVLPYGTYDYLMNISASGVPGQTLSGTLNATASNVLGWSAAFSGPVTISPNGTLTFNFSNGTWNIGGQTFTANGSGSLISQASAPATYSFSQTSAGYYQSSQVGGGPPYNATLTSNAWGQRTGEAAVSPGYFTLAATGSRSSNTVQFGNINGTYNSTMTGSVMGYPGQALIGTYNSSINDSLGWVGTYSGPVTILPDGSLYYGYRNAVLTKSGLTITGAGAGISRPGTYFSQTAVGSVGTTSDSLGKVQTITNLNSYPIWGSRTGVYPGEFAATLALTDTAPVSGYYPPSDQGSFTAQMQGVVSGPTGGAQSGVMTYSIGGGNPNAMTFAGPVTINPDGSLTSTFYGTNRDSGAPDSLPGYFRQQATWNQTAQNIPAPSTYSISAPIVSFLAINPISTSQANLYLTGYSLRNTSIPYPGFYMGGGDGTLTGPAGSFTVGNPISTNIYGNLTGSVTGVLGGYPLSGSGTFSGTGPEGRVEIPGTVTIQPNGRMIFEYSGGTVTFGGQTFTASGTLSQRYAIPFTESSSGTYQLVSGGGSQPTLLNTSQMTGSRTGLLSGPVNASMILKYGGSDFPFPLSPPTTGSIAWLAAGAVSPWYAGEQSSGVAIHTLTLNGGTPSAFVGHVTYDPTTGNLVRQLVVSPSPSWHVMGAMASAPQSSAQTTLAFAQEVAGNYQLDSGPPYNTATFTNSGALTGTMKVGGSGSITSYASKANFNITSSAAQTGAFPASESGSVAVNQFIGAAAGPVNGTLKGFSLSSVHFGSYNMDLDGAFTINTDPTLPPTQRLPATFELNGHNATQSGIPATQTGTWSQTDPPLTGRTVVGHTLLRKARAGGISPANRLQTAARLTQPLRTPTPAVLNRANLASAALRASRVKPAALPTSALPNAALTAAAASQQGRATAPLVRK